MIPNESDRSSIINSSRGKIKLLLILGSSV